MRTAHEVHLTDLCRKGVALSCLLEREESEESVTGKMNDTTTELAQSYPEHGLIASSALPMYWAGVRLKHARGRRCSGFHPCRASTSSTSAAKTPKKMFSRVNLSAATWESPIQ